MLQIKVVLQTFLEIQIRYYAAWLHLKKTMKENSCLPSMERSVLQQDISSDSVRNLIVTVWRGKSRSQTGWGVHYSESVFPILNKTSKVNIRYGYIKQQRSRFHKHP